MPLTLKSNLMSLNTAVDEGGKGVKRRTRRGREEIIRRYNEDGQRGVRVRTKLRGGRGREGRCLLTGEMRR